MNYWIDTHAHIYADEFKTQITDMLARAKEVEVKKIFMPNVDHTSIDAMLELESRHENCYAMMGLHPTSVKKDFEKELYLVEQWLSNRRFSAIGEIGTDLFWDRTFWEQQAEAFTIQVNWAKKHSLAVVIHCRESIDETIALVEKLQDGNLRGIFHCFTGTVQQAEKITALGFHVGLGGVVTFKNAKMEDVLPSISLEKIVLETDSPYLAPVPHRGKRNEPSYIPLIAQRIADIKKINLDALQQHATANALSIFQQND